MNLWSLSFAYLRRRWGGAVLTILVGALGLALLATVMTLTTEMPAAVKKALGGADMVVGPRGSELDLVLCCALQITSTRGLMSYRAAVEATRSPYIKVSVPVALGDSYNGARILWTRPDIVRIYDASFAQGRMFAAPLEAVVGAQVAKVQKLKLGDKLVSTHGFDTDGERHGKSVYKVTGILQPTGSVIDRVILSDLSSIRKVHAGLDADEHGPMQIAGQGYDKAGNPLAISAMLARFSSPVAAAIIPRQIGMETSLTAASPELELARLSALVRPAFNVLTAFGVTFGIVAAVMAALGLVNALNQRARNLALLRILGASRFKLARIALQEALILVHVAFILSLGLSAGLGAIVADRMLGYGLLIHVWPSLITMAVLYVGALLVGLAASVAPVVRVAMAKGEEVLKA